MAEEATLLQTSEVSTPVPTLSNFKRVIAGVVILGLTAASVIAYASKNETRSLRFASLMSNGPCAEKDGEDLELCSAFKQHCSDTMGPDETLNGCVANLYDVKDQCMASLSLDENLEDCMMEKLGLTTPDETCGQLDDEEKVYCYHFKDFCYNNLPPDMSLNNCVKGLTGFKDECVADMGLHETLEGCIKEKAGVVDDDDDKADQAGSEGQDDGLISDDGLGEDEHSTHDISTHDISTDDKDEDDKDEDDKDEDDKDEDAGPENLNFKSAQKNGVEGQLIAKMQKLHMSAAQQKANAQSPAHLAKVAKREAEKKEKAKEEAEMAKK